VVFEKLGQFLQAVFNSWDGFLKLRQFLQLFSKIKNKINK